MPLFLTAPESVWISVVVQRCESFKSDAAAFDDRFGLSPTNYLGKVLGFSEFLQNKGDLVPQAFQICHNKLCTNPSWNASQVGPFKFVESGWFQLVVGTMPSSNSWYSYV